MSTVHLDKRPVFDTAVSVLEVLPEENQRRVLDFSIRLLEDETINPPETLANESVIKDIIDSNVYNKNDGVTDTYQAMKDVRRRLGNTVERAYNLTRLAEMCDLEDGWDGDEGRQISRDMIAFVGGVLLRLGQQPEIYPTSEGGIQIQYEKPDKTYLEVVFSPEMITGMRIEKGDYSTAVFNDFEYTSEKDIADYIGAFCVRESRPH